MTLEEKSNVLCAMVVKSTDYLASAPAGKLDISKMRNNYHFYYVNHGNKKYLKKDSNDLIIGLAKKEYCQKMLEAVNAYKKQLSYQTDDCSLYSYFGKVFEQLHPAIKQYVEPFILPDELFIQKWLNAASEPNLLSFGSTEYYTENNERVRSKSELIIADKLKHSGITYRYEKELFLSNGLSYFPDFTVLDMTTRKEIYIEHCGMMDDSDYRASLYRKLANYAIDGIVTGKNLVLLFEERTTLLNTYVLDKVIASIKNDRC